MLRERACIAEGFCGLALAHSQPEVRDGASSFFLGEFSTGVNPRRLRLACILSRWGGSVTRKREFVPLGPAHESKAEHNISTIIEAYITQMDTFQPISVSSLCLAFTRCHSPSAPYF